MIYLGIIIIAMFICFLRYLVSIGARKEHFGKAALEIVVVYAISNLPVWLLIWAYVSRGNNNDDADIGMSTYLESVLNAGDVFIYVSAILAPVVWTLIAYFRESHRVLIAIYIVCIILILPFSAFAFQQARLVGEMDQEVFNNSAMFIYFVSLVLWYGTTVYARFVENYEPSSPGNKILKGLRG